MVVENVLVVEAEELVVDCVELVDTVLVVEAVEEVVE